MTGARLLCVALLFGSAEPLSAQQQQQHDRASAASSKCQAGAERAASRPQAARGGDAARADLEQAEAHRLAGHELVDGRWLTPDELRERGYVQHHGRWMRKYDVAVLRYREEKEQERMRLEKELNDCFRRLASESAAARAQALAQIEARADGLGWPDLALLGRKQKAAYDAAWHEHELTATVRLQSTRLLALEPFTTSLGVGQPVQLQLPRLQSTSVATTVVLPAGTGR